MLNTMLMDTPTHHSQPSADVVSCRHLASTTPFQRGAFAIRSISLITIFGMKKLATGMNQPPTVQPEDHVRGPFQSRCVTLCALFNQITISTNIAIQTRTRNPPTVSNASSMSTQLS